MMTCDNCGGTGNDLGSLNPYYPDPCPVCDGSGTADYDDTNDIECREERERLMAAWA